MAKKTAPQRFAICVSNADCDDLQVWKLYRVLPDAAAQRDDFLRIIDDSGEDYLYPAKRFVLVDLPLAVVKKLQAAPLSKGA